MNQVQRVYIRKRVEGILASKLADARVKFTIKADMLPHQERIQLIRAGKVKVKSEKDLMTPGNYGNLYVNTIFDFSKYETKGGLDQKAYQACSKKLTAKAHDINDSVMLGDAEEALKMIKDFERFNG